MRDEREKGREREIVSETPTLWPILTLYAHLTNKPYRKVYIYTVKKPKKKNQNKTKQKKQTKNRFPQETFKYVLCAQGKLYICTHICMQICTLALAPMFLLKSKT